MSSLGWVLHQQEECLYPATFSTNKKNVFTWPHSPPTIMSSFNQTPPFSCIWWFFHVWPIQSLQKFCICHSHELSSFETFYFKWMCEGSHVSFFFSLCWEYHWFCMQGINLLALPHRVRYLFFYSCIAEKNNNTDV